MIANRSEICIRSHRSEWQRVNGSLKRKLTVFIRLRTFSNHVKLYLTRTSFTLLCLNNSLAKPKHKVLRLTLSLRLLGESGILDEITLGPWALPRTCCAIQTGLFVAASAYPTRANDPRYSIMTGSTPPTPLIASTAGDKNFVPSSWTAIKTILL